jgi:hypothetical protein
VRVELIDTAFVPCAGDDGESVEVGATEEKDKIVGDAPAVLGFANILNLVGQGQAPNLLVHETFHLTVNADGVTTVDREVQPVVCQ